MGTSEVGGAIGPIILGGLVFGYAPLQGLRASTFLLCVFLTFYEVERGIMFNMAKDNYRIGNNPKLIHNNNASR